MSLTPEDLLQHLVRIPSVNPRSSGTGESACGEAQITDFLARTFTDLGWPWLRLVVDAGSDNIVALASGSLGAAEPAPLLFDAHQDTVGVAGMTVDPFAAECRDGKIFGRGACDIKGGMAAMIAALAGSESTQPILMACTVNEEAGFTGAAALAQLWQEDGLKKKPLQVVGGDLPLESLVSQRPRAAIVAEPTELQVVVAHKGVVRWRCRTHGRAAHSSRPEKGANAVYAMANIVRAIADYDQTVLATRAVHPRCGRPTISVGTIQGGTDVNTVPDAATIDIDRRLMPQESPTEAYNAVIEFVASHADLGACQIEHEPPWMQSDGLAEEPANTAWGKQVAAVARELGHNSQLVGVPYGTNAWVFARAGIPTVVFGPGSIAQAHTADEWIAIDQLHAAMNVFKHIATAK